VKVDTYKCDICGTIKGENNHWFRVDGGIMGLELNPWGIMPPTGTTLDLCSDQCVIKVVQKWLTEQAQTSGARYPDLRSSGIVSVSGQRVS
jgi:hypothetical protein